MKNLGIFLTAMLMTTLVNAQINHPELVRYGASLNVIGSGSGHGTNVSMNFVAGNEFKSIEFGSIFRKDIPQWKGVDFKYKVYTGKYNYYYNNTQIKPYVVYNCIYQSEYVFEDKIFSTPTATYEIPDETGGRISTIEHHAGFGTSFRFINNFYVDMNLAAGVYLGSLKKNTTPNTLGIHKYNHGFTTSFKIGVGYYIL